MPVSLSQMEGDSAAMMVNLHGDLKRVADYLTIVKGTTVTVQDVVKAIRESLKREKEMGLM